MTQQNINVGTGPDSYTGESLRTAFQKVNDNFSQLYAGNVGANISGNIITANGFVTSGNVVTGNATAAGNISAYYFTGNGSQLTGIGYLNMPQVLFTANTTLTATDAGKHYYSVLATANTLTIANNTSVSWAVGTEISIVNRGTGTITMVQGTGVSLYLAGNNTASNRTISTYGMATLLNVESNTWMINGTGVA